jgi:SAM-dependent methyltransferase
MYGSASLYDRILSFLHGEGYEDRFQRIAACLPANAWVLDVGCGTCHMAELLPAGMRYTGLDLNRGFVAAARDRGIDARIGDVLDVAAYPEGPTAVVVSDMLHHIVPHESLFLRKLGRALRSDLVICETLTTGSNALQRVAGLLLDNDGFNDFRARLRFHLWGEFTEESLTELLKQAIPTPAPRIQCTENPGKVRRGMRFHTLLAHYRGAPPSPNAPAPNPGADGAA